LYWVVLGQAKEHNVSDWLDIKDIHTSLLENLWGLKFKSFKWNLRGTDDGKLLDEYVSKGDIVPPELTVKLLIKCIE
jgi:hypothetical protein